jgi:GT2 family glycosyltransferase
MVQRLVQQLLPLSEVSQVLVTLNIPEALVFPADKRIQVIKNESPKGFAANHNATFSICSQPFFCPLNPDIELIGNPFPALLAVLSDEQVGMVAPRVDSSSGEHEDSWRRFPTLGLLLLKLFGGGDGRYALPLDGKLFFPEWVAGMFMLFRSEVFRSLQGFDEGYFLYYEDVDICVRLWRMKKRITACPTVAVIHDARRDSHHKWRHLRWHIGSMVRYFSKYWLRLPRSPRNC